MNTVHDDVEPARLRAEASTDGSFGSATACTISPGVSKAELPPITASWRCPANVKAPRQVYPIVVIPVPDARPTQLVTVASTVTPTWRSELARDRSPTADTISTTTTDASTATPATVPTQATRRGLTVPPAAPRV